MPISTGLFTMPAAPGVQDITGLGYDPPDGSALVLWCVGNLVDGTWTDSIRFAFGFTDGTNSYSCANGMDDNVSPTQAYARAAAKVLTIIDGNGVVLGEADFTGWITDGARITWTIATGTQFLIAYKIIAGDGLQSFAQEWHVLVNGNLDMAASGFQPQSYFQMSAGLATAAPSGATRAQFSIGMADYNNNQMQHNWRSDDNDAAVDSLRDTSNNRVAQHNEAIFGNPSLHVAHVAMLAAGYRVDVVSHTKDYYMYSLELAGLDDVLVGTFAPPIGLGQLTYGTGFQCNGVFNFGSGPALISGRIGHLFSSFGMCGVLGTDVVGTISEPAGNNPSQGKVLLKSGKSFAKAENVTQTIEQEAHVNSYPVNGYELDWTIVDGTTNPNRFYMAFAAPDVPTPPLPTIPAPCAELEGKYEVWLLDHNGDRIHLLDGDVEVLEYVIATNGSGSRGWGSFRVEGSADLLPVDDFTLDRIISIRRKFPCGDFRIEFEGFIRRTEFWFDQIDKEHFRASGPDLKSLVRRRIIVPEAGEDWFVTTDELTDIMRFAVRYQGGPLTIDIDRKFQLLDVEADTDEGDAFEWRARYVPLDEELLTLADAGASFDIERVADVYTFRVFFPRQGMDLRKNNADGNTPTVFSLGLANMRLPAVVEDRLQERNVVYVGGDGIGSDRDITERDSLWDADEDSPFNFNRMEAFVEAGQESSAAGRAAQGDAFLAENRRLVTFSFQAHQTIRTLYEQDWDVGDLVTAEYRGVDYDVRIDAVRIRLDAAQGEQIFPTFRLLPEELV